MQTLSFLSSVGGLKKIKDNLLYFFYCLTFVKELSFLFQIHFVKTGQTLHSGNINMNQSRHSYEPITSKAILTQTLSFLVPPSQVWYVEFSIENKVQMVVRVFCLYLQFNLCLCLNWYFSHTHLSYVPSTFVASEKTKEQRHCRNQLFVFLKVFSEYNVHPRIHTGLVKMGKLQHRTSVGLSFLNYSHFLKFLSNLDSSNLQMTVWGMWGLHCGRR